MRDALEDLTVAEMTGMMNGRVSGAGGSHMLSRPDVVIVKKHEHTVLALHCAKRSALHAMER